MMLKCTFSGFQFKDTTLVKLFQKHYPEERRWFDQFYCAPWGISLSSLLQAYFKVVLHKCTLHTVERDEVYSFCDGSPTIR